MRNCLVIKCVIGTFVMGVFVAGLLAQGCSSPGPAEPAEEPAGATTETPAGTSETGTSKTSAPEEATPSSVTDTGEGSADSAAATSPETTSPETTASAEGALNADSPSESPAGDVTERTVVEAASPEGAQPGGAHVEDATPVNASSGEKPTVSGVPRAQAALLSPTLSSDTAPAVFKVKFSTTKGDFILEVHRDWAPNGADRLYNLAKVGFFNGVAFFRVMKNFVVQFGIHGDPEVSAAWLEASIPDDPPSEATSNTRGMVSFADRRSPNTRTTQLFINLAGMNSYLDEEGYAPVGEVIEGMEVVDSLYNGYGDGAPRGPGPSQAAIQSQGNEYLKREFPKLDYIEGASIIE